MTNRNPNVFYEVGYAHVLEKTTILLTKNSEDIPFNLKHYPHIIYNNKISKLKEELTNRVKWCVENESSNDIDQKIGIDIYLNDKSLSNNNVVYKVLKGKIPNPAFTVHNNTFTTFSPSDYGVIVITDQNYIRLRVNNNPKTNKLPDGRLIHMFPLIEDVLYPNSYTSFRIVLKSKVFKYSDDIYKTPKVIYKEDQEIIIRIFTPNGTRNFYLNIEYEK